MISRAQLALTCMADTSANVQSLCRTVGNVLNTSNAHLIIRIYAKKKKKEETGDQDFFSLRGFDLALLVFLKHCPHHGFGKHSVSQDLSTGANVPLCNQGCNRHQYCRRTSRMDVARRV